jgi:hypothetical protein
VIKLSIKLARADGVPVSEELIGNVILRTGNFSNEERKGDTQR